MVVVAGRAPGLRVSISENRGHLLSGLLSRNRPLFGVASSTRSAVGFTRLSLAKRTGPGLALMRQGTALPLIFSPLTSRPPFDTLADMIKSILMR